MSDSDMSDSDNFNDSNDVSNSDMFTRDKRVSISIKTI